MWPWIQQLIDIWRTFSGRRSELESLGQYCYLLFPAISRIFPVCNSKYFPSPKHDIALSKLILWESSMTCCHSYLERSSHAAASNKYSISFPLDLKLAFLQISFKKTFSRRKHLLGANIASKLWVVKGAEATALSLLTITQRGLTCLSSNTHFKTANVHLVFENHSRVSVIALTLLCNSSFCRQWQDWPQFSSAQFFSMWPLETPAGNVTGLLVPCFPRCRCFRFHDCLHGCCRGWQIVPDNLHWRAFGESSDSVDSGKSSDSYKSAKVLHGYVLSCTNWETDPGWPLWQE